MQPYILISSSSEGMLENMRMRAFKVFIETGSTVLQSMI